MTTTAENGSPEESKMFDFSILRQLRKREGLNIGDVSRRSGVSSSVISKLERNQTQAGLETLYRLSRVFGMSATDLLALTESRLAHRKKAEAHVAGGFHFQEITYANLRCLAGKALAGARVSRPEIHRDDYEICWVLHGRIRFTLPHEIHDLAAGESIQFDAIFDHVYEAREDSEILIIHLRKDKRF